MYSRNAAGSCHACASMFAMRGNCFSNASGRTSRGRLAVHLNVDGNGVLLGAALRTKLSAARTADGRDSSGAPVDADRRLPMSLTFTSLGTLEWSVR